MYRCLAFIFAACVLFTPSCEALAQETKPSRTPSAAGLSQPILVAGTEFMIIEAPAQKGPSEKPRQRLPIVVVIFLWIVAMFLWQLYFNRKQR